MKYKPNDKVRVRSDLESDEYYGGRYFTEDMLRLIGKIVTISKVYDNYYNIKEMGYGWADEMLEPLDKSIDYSNFILSGGNDGL